MQDDEFYSAVSRNACYSKDNGFGRKKTAQKVKMKRDASLPNFASLQSGASPAWKMSSTWCEPSTEHEINYSDRQITIFAQIYPRTQ